MPEAHNQKLGTFGERVAIAHLEEKGYTIRETNFRVREGEVDIVAEQGDTLVFVEVKTRRGVFVRPMRTIWYGGRPSIRSPLNRISPSSGR